MQKSLQARNTDSERLLSAASHVEDIGAVHGYTVMCVQERAENSALRGFSVEGQWGGDVAAYFDHLPSACSEVQDPAAQIIIQT